jgi:hypothetical protein
MEKTYILLLGSEQVFKSGAMIVEASHSLRLRKITAKLMEFHDKTERSIFHGVSSTLFGKRIYGACSK